MSEKVTDLSCRGFIGALASASPTPGGGGAAALVGAVGAALGHMVGSLTVGKKKYADVENELQSLNARAVRIQDTLLTLAEQDAQVFAPLARAYSLPAETEEQRTQKAETLEPLLHGAALVPLEIMDQCIRALEVIERFAQIGSRLAISDAGCAAACVHAALRSASLNVRINTRSMKDRVCAKTLDLRTKALLDDGCARADAIFALVQTQLETGGKR